jgi:DNA modification methylase
LCTLKKDEPHGKDVGEKEEDSDELIVPVFLHGLQRWGENLERKNFISEKLDLFLQGLFMQLYHADLFEVLPTLEEGSVKLALMDLPYGRTRSPWDKGLNLKEFWEALKPVLALDAAVLLWADSHFQFKLFNSNPSWFKYLWIWEWEKSNGTGFFHAGKRPLLVHEFILVFHQKQPTFNPQLGVGKPYGGYESKEKKLGEIYGENTVSKHKKNDGTRQPRSVIKEFPSIETELMEEEPVTACPILYATTPKNKKGHPTPKPEDILRYLIRTYTNEGDVVLDACMGGGSTGLAALKEKRDFIGIEKNDTFYTLAEERINDWLTGGISPENIDERQMSLFKELENNGKD